MQAPHSRSDSRRRSPTKLLIALLLATIAIVVVLIYVLRDESPTAATGSRHASLPRSGYLNRALWRSDEPSESDPQAREKPSISGLVYDMEGSVIPGARVAATTFQLAGNIKHGSSTHSYNKRLPVQVVGLQGVKKRFKNRRVVLRYLATRHDEWLGHHGEHGCMRGKIA